MIIDRFRDRLSEYLDGDLKPDEQRLIERHLEGCGECARTLAQLESVVAQAHQVPEREPAQDLWPTIAARLGEPAEDEGPLPRHGALGSSRRGRRIAFSVPQLAAAAVILASVSAGAAWLAGSGPTGGFATAAADGPGQLVSTDPETSTAELYAASIAELERTLFDPARPLPDQTAARVRRALMTIDRAIEDARQALLEVPDDPYLKEHMTSTMQRKSDFLERAVRLAAQS